MQVSALQRSVKAADIPLEQLANNNALSESQKVTELSRQFEALLVRQILTEAQKNTLAPTLESNGVSNSIYQGIIAQIQAENISHSGALGVARALERQLQRQMGERTEVQQEHESGTLTTD